MAKQSLKERLAKRRQELKDRTSGGKVKFIKEGTTRIRILPVGPDDDWAREINHFYLGNRIKGIFSASSIGKACPIMEAFQEYQKDRTKDDLTKEISPRKKYLVAAVVYEDEAGKKIDDRASGKLVLIPNGIYGQMIDFFLDPELGDFTDPENGYDLKIKRMGKGLKDTEYTVTPGRPSKLPKKFHAPVNLDALVEEIFEPYDEVETKLADYLLELGSGEDEDEEERPRPKKKKIRKTSK